jgi:hypothetical protein
VRRWALPSIYTLSYEVTREQVIAGLKDVNVFDAIQNLVGKPLFDLLSTQLVDIKTL